jgi:hypothetical protein
MSAPPTLSYATPTNRVWPAILLRVILTLNGSLNALFFLLAVTAALISRNVSFMSFIMALGLFVCALIYFFGQFQIPKRSIPWLRLVLIATIFQLALMGFCNGSIIVTYMRDLHDPLIDPGDRVAGIVGIILSLSLTTTLPLPQLIFLLLVRRHFKKHPQG